MEINAHEKKKKKYSSDCEKENFIWSFATHVVYIRPWKQGKILPGNFLSN